MKKALKNFGLGLLYFFVSPLLLAILAVGMVFGLFVLVVKDIQGIVRFFKGEKTFFEDWPEDKKVAEIQAAQAYAAAHPATPQQPTPTTNNQVYIQQNYYPGQSQVPPQPSSLQPASYPSPNPDPYATQNPNPYASSNPATQPIDVSSNPVPPTIDVSGHTPDGLPHTQDTLDDWNDPNKGGTPS